MDKNFYLPIILIIAFVISWLSTFFATQRFLNLQTEKLYY